MRQVQARFHGRRPPVAHLLAGSFLLASTLAQAGDGLRLSAGDQADGPRWQWRIGHERERATRHGESFRPTPQAAAWLLGDLYRAPSHWQAWGLAWEGAPRATSGLLSEHRSSWPGERAAAAGTWPGLSLGGAAMPTSTALWPYLGVGYTGLSRRSGWGFSADVGIIARPPAGAEGPGMHGEPLAEETLRRIRLESLLRLHVQYAF